MNQEDLHLIIQINYNNKSFSIDEINLIDLNEIVNQCVQKFNIDTKFEKSIIFTYIDKDGDKNIICNKEDIINSSFEIGSNKYLSQLYLEIISNDFNNEIGKIDLIPKSKNFEYNEEIQRLEEMNNLKENKIIELESKILKLEKECRKLKSDKSNKVFKEEIKIDDNKNQLDNDFIKTEIKNVINEMFKLERENINNELKKFKDNLISNMNKNEKKDDKNDLLNNILEDLSFIKANIETNIEDKNKTEKNEENMNYNNFLFNNMPMMKPNKMYKCQNCNSCYIFNECFDISKNKSYKEHNFKLNDENNINEQDVILNENEILINDKNKINENKEEKIKENKENINIINNYIDNQDKKEDKDRKKEEDINEDDEEEIKENKEEEIKKNNEEEIEGENNDYEDDLKFQDILQSYFFNERRNLKTYDPNQNELNQIKEYYKIFYEKNKDFKTFQENFIVEVDKEISKIKFKNHIYPINRRKQRLQNLLTNFLNEIENEKNRKNNKNYRYNNRYYNRYNKK